MFLLSDGGHGCDADDAAVEAVVTYGQARAVGHVRCCRLCEVSVIVGDSGFCDAVAQGGVGGVHQQQPQQERLGSLAADVVVDQ